MIAHIADFFPRVLGVLLIIGELSMCFWLLIKGVRESASGFGRGAA